MRKVRERIMETTLQQVTGVVLAGGRGARMGGEDKGLLMLQGRLMIEWILDRFAPQVTTIVISANRNNDQYAALGYPIVSDSTVDFRGPLAGISAALSRTDTPWIVTVPCDSPLIPLDLVTRLQVQVVEQGANLGVAHDGQRLQPVFMFVHRDLLVDLEGYLEGGDRKIDRWLERHPFQKVDFSDSQEMFVNVNTPVDLEAVGACL